MPATKKSLRERYPHRLCDPERTMIYNALKWDRYILSGRNPSYDPNLGDRKKHLRKQCAKSVIRLVLGRYRAW
ncbi:hypothetical protein GC170_14650 [bacterium]|nr:hypothetical protein [bacterium]